MGLGSRLRRHRYPLLAIALLILLPGGGALERSGPWRSIAGAQDPGHPPAPARIPVVSAPARTRNEGVYLNGLPSVTPPNTETVRTRVDRELTAGRFQA